MPNVSGTNTVPTPFCFWSISGGGRSSLVADRGQVIERLQLFPLHHRDGLDEADQREGAEDDTVDDETIHGDADTFHGDTGYSCLGPCSTDGVHDDASADDDDDAHRHKDGDEAKVDFLNHLDRDKERGKREKKEWITREQARVFKISHWILLWMWKMGYILVVVQGHGHWKVCSAHGTKF